MHVPILGLYNGVDSENSQRGWTAGEKLESHHSTSGWVGRGDSKQFYKSCSRAMLRLEFQENNLTRGIHMRYRAG